MQDRRRTTDGLAGWSAFALATAMAVASLGSPALAHEDGHGELTFHDGEDEVGQGSADVAQPPVELSCRFWIEGATMSHGTGTIEATPSIPSSDLSATLGTWTASEDGNGTYSFEAGPFTLPETGVYRVWAEMDADHRTVAHEVAYEGCDDGSGGEKIEPPVDIG